jgi:HD superfamily phosphohydrolase YqeK
MSKNNSNKILDEILADKLQVTCTKEEDKILKPLLNQINLILDENVRSFVRSILYRAEGFWKIPSSFSGKYHPSDEHGEGGNVLHTKRAVEIVKIMCESYSLPQEDVDIVIAATLLHDITKGVKDSGSNEYRYDPMHPYTVGLFVKKCQEEDKNYASEAQSSTLFLSEDTVQSILRLVRCHLGPWSPVPETTPITFMDMIVHMADNISSKLHNIVDANDVVESKWKNYDE